VLGVVTLVIVTYFLFYCYGGVRQCGYGVHGGNTTNCDPWEPEA